MTANQDACILLFVKYPEKGKVKIRLTADLNAETVLSLYQCFVHDTLETVKKIDIHFFICYTPADKLEEFQRWLGSTLRFHPQIGNDLGERMKTCFTTVFEKGFKRVILIGSDSPDLPEDYITEAFSLLQAKDVVLGPAVDGGYYLIGLRDTTSASGLFEDIPWGTKTVLEETLKRVRQANRSIGLVPVWSDVDTITDLKNLIIRSNNTSFISSQTMSYIHNHRIAMEDANGE